MLDIINIHKTFNKGTINEKVALDGVTLHLNEGDFCTIIGGNGAGKSTTLNAVAGVWPVDSGQILIDGVDVTGLPEHKKGKVSRQSFPRPYDRYCCRYGNFGKPCPCGKKRQEKRS